MPGNTEYRLRALLPHHCGKGLFSRGKISLCLAGYPQTHNSATLVSKCWNYRCAPPFPVQKESELYLLFWVLDCRLSKDFSSKLKSTITYRYSRKAKALGEINWNALWGWEILKEIEGWVFGKAKKLICGAGEKTQKVRWSALTGQLTTTSDSSPRESDALISPLWEHTWYTSIYTDKIPMHIKFLLAPRASAL